MGLVPSEYDSGISFDTAVVLTESVEYICPSDGYFRLSCPATANVVAYGYINDMSSSIIALISSASGTIGTQKAAVFVKQGMIIKYASNNQPGVIGVFYPLK